jgi:hypothetical protein
MSRTLRDALDVYHQVQSETTVRIIKLEKIGLSPWQISGTYSLIYIIYIIYLSSSHSVYIDDRDGVYSVLSHPLRLHF